MKTIRILAMIITLLIVVPAASCGEKGNGIIEQTNLTSTDVTEAEATPGSGVGSAETAAESVPADTEATPDLPENIKFKLLDDGTYCVYAVYEAELPEEIEIPGEYYGKPVTVIEYEGFREQKNLKRVSIGEGITSIENFAFLECDNLKEVLLPASLTRLGPLVFSGCKNLKKVTIPDGVQTSGSFVFEDCESLELNEYGGALYLGSPSNQYFWLIRAKDPNVQEVTVAEGARFIEDRAFNGCTSLKSVKIPASVNYIGTAAFHECNLLTELELPAGLTEIPGQLFYHCSSLEKVNVPDGVISIGRDAFCCCSSLKNLVIPESVIVVYPAAFEMCSSLESITFLNRNVVIGAAAFHGCKSLRAIPDFETDCIYDTWFAGCESLTDVVVPDGATEIYWYAFCGCTNLTTLTLPESLKTVRLEAFENCPNLKTIIFKGTAEQFAGIKIDEGNDALLNAELKTAG